MAGLVAIHQPNFFPWLGYFDKIRRADIFIFLDAVHYPRSGSGGMGSWCNRVKVSVQGAPAWITCPVRRMPLGAPILAATIDDSQTWRTKVLKTLETNYRRAPRYETAMSLLEPLIRAPQDNLAEFNMNAVRAISMSLGLNAHFLRQSTLSCEGQSTQLLASLVRSVGGSTYLAGGGAGGYQEDDVFADNGVELLYQNYSPALYGPIDRYIPGLSVIDYLMHDGRPWLEAFGGDQHVAR